MSTPTELRYADSHEWLKLEGDGTLGTIGITDHAQHELSDVVFVELPKVGKVVAAKAPIAVVESVKAASDIYSPVAGEVVEVNAALETEPALVNTDPYGKGWIYKIKLAAPADAASLKDAAAYDKLLAGS
jgi:glycine cleavage system H protein